MNSRSTQLPRRVLMTADTVGGVWTYAIELSRILTSQGIQVNLVTMGAPLQPAQYAQARAIPGLGVVETNFQLEWMEDPWWGVERAGELLLGLAEQLRPDVIHLNGYAHGALPWRAPVLVVGHSCVLSWWQDVHRENAPAKYDQYREAVTRGIRAADRVIAPSRAMLAKLDSLYGALPPARVICNARSAAPFQPGAKSELVFAAGRLWDEAKNITALTGIAPQLPWPVYVAGGNEHPDGRRIDHPQVNFLGPLPEQELASWLARASIFALPARYEPFGLAVLEAALAGCALVLGDIPSLREIWEGAACFVAPNDGGALKAALLALMGDPGKLKELAACSRQRALAFTPERMGKAYLEVYTELLSGDPDAAHRRTDHAHSDVLSHAVV